MRLRRANGMLVCGVCCGLLALPAGAEAGTVSIRKDPRPGSELSNAVYTANPREANRLVIDFQGFLILLPGGDAMSGPGTVTFTDPVGVTAGSGCLQSGPNRARCPVDGEGQPSLLRTIADLRDGNDTAGVTGGPASIGSVTLSGGAGDDYLRGGGGGVPDELSGGAGNDVLQAGDAGGTTTMRAGSKVDGRDTFVGGDGFDTVSYRDRRARLRISLNGKADDGAAGERDDVSASIDSVSGGRAGDRIIGSRGNDELLGNGGSDLLDGRGGGDVLRAGKGRTADRLRGGAGPDLLIGSRGPNRMAGGPGNDTLRGGAGGDRLNVRDGYADEVHCGKSRDRVKLDRFDFFGLGCERRTRRRGVAVRLLQTRATLDDDSDTAAFQIGCPADGPRRCRGRFDVFKSGKRRSRDRFSIRRGSVGFAFTKSGTGSQVVGDVRLKVVSRNAAGRVVVQRARGHIDPPPAPDE